jgi:hypothetical protein
MKKNAKIRLTLNRETLRNLSVDEMPGAQGGAVVVNTTVCPVILTNTCVTYTCPTKCGQTYCYYV